MGITNFDHSGIAIQRCEVRAAMHLTSLVCLTAVPNDNDNVLGMNTMGWAANMECFEPFVRLISF
jgi:hypothetical protein